MNILNNLPDIQKNIPDVKKYINLVGVDKVKVPVKIHVRSDKIHETVASVSMTCDLKKDIKGISMSRFIRSLKPFLYLKLNKYLILEILKEFLCQNDSKSARIKFEFELPTIKKSLVSSQEFPEYYKSKFIGFINSESFDNINQSFKFFEYVEVPYSSYCPCSAELCKDLKSKGYSGFPHAQRSFAKVLVETDLEKIVWLEDLIELVESAVINIPYPIIKREDEQRIAQIASDHPMFVEDAVRKIAYNIDSHNGITDWTVRCVHEESIHTSRAIASMWKGDENYTYLNMLIDF